jgi:hypothetical protein
LSLLSSGVLGWFAAERSAAGFSHVASNFLVAGGRRNAFGRKVS